MNEYEALVEWYRQGHQRTWRTTFFAQQPHVYRPKSQTWTLQSEVNCPSQCISPCAPSPSL